METVYIKMIDKSPILLTVQHVFIQPTFKHSILSEASLIS